MDNGPARNPNMPDKRPKKEKELREYLKPSRHDMDYEEYGYYHPVKVSHDHFTLRQFDEFMREMSSKNVTELNDEMKNMCEKIKIDPETAKILFHYLKPFSKFEKNNQK